MSYQYIFVMKSLRKAFSGGKEIFRDIWLSFFSGAKIGIIGPNGSGKSTLLKIMGGLDKDFQGEAWPAKGIKVGYLPQEPKLNPSLTVMENIMEGLQEIKNILDQFEAVNVRFCEPLDEETMKMLLIEQGNLQEKIDAADAWNLERKIEIAIDALRCPPSHAPVHHLSGGEKRRVALCLLLLQNPDLLLLDEPTNHLDAESVSWLERYLQNYKGTVVLITHDRYFLDHVVSWILELDRGQGFSFEGNYSAWLEQKRLEFEKKQNHSRQKQLQRELEWIRQAPKARQAKSKARFQAYEQLLNQTNDRVLSENALMIPAGPKLGDVVTEVKNISKSYDNCLLIDNVTFSLPRGGIVGVIGPNGAGKTTLFRLLTGHESLDQGNIKIGETVVFGYVDQSRDLLNNHKTVLEEISDGLDEIVLGKKVVSNRAYCALFNFKGADQQKKLNQLSGGERNRVHLAKVLKSKANVLLLDEPTNDLDIETLRSLEEALLDFAGCAIIISHDRFFLDRVATHILAFEGDSQVVWFEGNYQAYEEDKKRRLGVNQPHRIRYKPLIRA